MNIVSSKIKLNLETANKAQLTWLLMQIKKRSKQIR